MRMVAKKIEKSPMNCVCVIRTTCSTIMLPQWRISNCSRFSHLGQGPLSALAIHHPSLTYPETHFTSKYCFRVANKGPGLLNREGVVRMRKSGKRQASLAERWVGVCWSLTTGGAQGRRPGADLETHWRWCAVRLPLEEDWRFSDLQSSVLIILAPPPLFQGAFIFTVKIKWKC